MFFNFFLFQCSLQNKGSVCVQLFIDLYSDIQTCITVLYLMSILLTPRVFYHLQHPPYVQVTTDFSSPAIFHLIYLGEQAGYLFYGICEFSVIVLQVFFSQRQPLLRFIHPGDIGCIVLFYFRHTFFCKLTTESSILPSRSSIPNLDLNPQTHNIVPFCQTNTDHLLCLWLQPHKIRFCELSCLTQTYLETKPPSKTSALCFQIAALQI